MNRGFLGVILITAVIGTLFIAGDIYPAIRTSSLEESVGLADNKTEEMLQELTKDKTERGMTGDLKADLEKAIWFSSNKETIRAKGEVFQDLIGYSEVKDLKTMIQKEIGKPGDETSIKETVASVTTASSIILPRPSQKEIKKEIERRGLDKNSTVQKPMFSILRVPEREEISVPVDEDSALPYTSILLVSMILGSLVSFVLTCTWCTWALSIPKSDFEKRKDDEVELRLAA